MNEAHLHLLLNHFPVIGIFFSVVLLAFGLFRSNEGWVRAGLLLALLSGLFAIPAFLTGEPAEELLEKAPGFSKALVEEHEEAAEFAIWSIEIAAAAAAIGLYLSSKKNRIPRPLMIAIMILLLFSLTVTGRTNNLGGKISHPEIRD